MPRPVPAENRCSGVPEHPSRGKERRVSARRRRGERRTLFRCAGSDAAQAASAEKRARLSTVPRRITFAGAIVKRPLRRKPSADRTHALPGKKVAALRETALRTAPRLEAGMRPRQKCVRRRNRRRIGSTASFFSPVRPCVGPDRKLGSAGIPGVAQTVSRRFRALMRPAFFPPTEPEGFRPARLRPCALRPRRSFPRLRGRVPPAGSADRRRG